MSRAEYPNNVTTLDREHPVVRTRRADLGEHALAVVSSLDAAHYAKGPAVSDELLPLESMSVLFRERIDMILDGKDARELAEILQLLRSAGITHA